MSGRDLVSEMRSGGKPARAPMPSGGVLDLAAIAVAVIAVASLGYFGVTAWLAPHAPQPAALVQVPQASLEAWSAEDTSTCEARARKASADPLPDDVVFAQRSVTEGFAGMATMLACRMSVKAERFCDPVERRKLVAMINDYLGRVDLITLGLGVQGAPMKLVGGMLGGEAAFGSSVYESQREDTMKVMAFHHEKIVAALRSLARDGIVVPEDFAAFMGMGVSKAVTGMFGGVAAERHVCA